MAEDTGEKMLEEAAKEKHGGGNHGGRRDGNECWQCNFNKQEVEQENECGNED